MSAQPILVSVIISVQNEGIDLQTTLESMKVSRVALSYEVIIVDEGSVDGCCDFLIHYKFDNFLRSSSSSFSIAFFSISSIIESKFDALPPNADCC